MDADHGRAPPEFEDWEEPETLLSDRPIRERLLDVALQLREPTAVSTVAERADCDPETAREYLRWFTDVGVVDEHPGRPVAYEANRSYLRWRRVEAIRREHTAEEIAAELDEVTADLSLYRERFDASHPDDVSVFDAADAGAADARVNAADAEAGDADARTDAEDDVADTWRALSDWKTARERAELLDAARRRGADSSRGPVRADD